MRKLQQKREQMGTKICARKQRLAKSFILVLLCLSLPWICFSADGASGRVTLVAEEVNALREVGSELGKSDWDFSVDPCSNNTSWRSEFNTLNPNRDNQITCTCSGGSCHVDTISLQGQDLAGVLPKSLPKLPYLKSIYLSRNYLTGSIPQEWASTSLEAVILDINRLSGPIPKHLGNITTLVGLNIEDNVFSGPVPAELGQLVNLKYLVLSSNYLNGQLPEAFTNLSKLTTLRISSNSFSGKIPDYFQSWTALRRLDIQSSGFKGLIPSSISNLTNLFVLRISDLHGEESDFPQLQNMRSLTFLMLRNCNISGSIPGYLASLSDLDSLDLSFNNLEGPIPDGLQSLNLSYMYLTSNFLTGPIPDWVQHNDYSYIDLSYNNFRESSVPSSCNKENLNLYRSSSRKLNSSLAVCLKIFPCSRDRHSLYINCGGNEIKIGETTYEADNINRGVARFIPKKAEWGYSSTGNFLDAVENFIEKNDSVVPLSDANLYTEARTAAISLTYYGRCLAKGSYTVTLHFAEIKFSTCNSFSKLGRRIFDVYIQEKLVLQDFDIVKAAFGAEKVYKATFNNISLDTGTVEIRFYYAGKGTTTAPVLGTYGPLISAISVESEISLPPHRKGIIKIVVGSSASLASAILLVIIAYRVYIRRHPQTNSPSREEVLRGIDLQTVFFTYQQIKAATDDFDPANKIGQGGFGSVYRGTLLDGTYIAVKQLSPKSSQGNKEFITEIGMISGLHHPNLVKLYGCCVEGSQLFLVYEYMVNNNLARALFDDDCALTLDWPTRQKVCIEIARGLEFLHEGSAIRIVHRDIKATNILLDENLNANISDFGLARLREEENTHISTKVAGTIGYMSPEYALWGYLTYKADVYSFGVLTLEIVAGRNNVDFQRDEHTFCLLDWAAVQHRRGNLMAIIDTRLGSEYNKKEAVRMIKIALLCTNASPSLRPTMSEAVSMLEGKLSVQEIDINTNVHGWMVDFRDLEKMEPAEIVSETQSLIHSSEF